VTEGVRPGARGGGARTGDDPRWPAATVIVVGYRSRGDLDRCLSAVRRQHARYPAPVEAIFVDNASGDGSADHVREAFPEVVTIESGGNLGFAGANNLGAERARGEVLAFLNPDTEAADDWLVELVRPLLAEPDVGLTTSKILLMDDRGTVNACGNEVSLGGITWCRGLGRAAAEFRTDADVAAVSGCAFAVRAELFRRLGGFDASFFMYLEDTDLSWRARAAGYRCRFAAASVVWHDYRLNLSPAKIGWIERNRYRMLGKQLSRRALLALAPSLLLTEALTWGYAILGGPRALTAKARATAAAPGALRPALRGGDPAAAARLLREHRAAPSMSGTVGGPAARAAERVFGPLFRGAAAVAFALLPVDPPAAGWVRPEARERLGDAAG